MRFFHSLLINQYKIPLLEGVHEGSTGCLVNPQAPDEGEILLPHSRAIFSKLKNEDKDLFSYRNCKK